MIIWLMFLDGLGTFLLQLKPCWVQKTCGKNGTYDNYLTVFTLGIVDSWRLIHLLLNLSLLSMSPFIRQLTSPLDPVGSAQRVHWFQMIGSIKAKTGYSVNWTHFSPISLGWWKETKNVLAHARGHSFYFTFFLVGYSSAI